MATPTAPAPQQSYTVEEVADIFRVVPETVRKWLRNGTIKGNKIPALGDTAHARWRISLAEVQRLQGDD
jgi:excisionase family DNA binding protein